MKQYRVYALIDNGARLGIAIIFEGSRTNCYKYIKARKLSGHFVSYLNTEAAYNRYVGNINRSV